MTDARYRAWQFTHPDFDIGGGSEPGLSISTTGGVQMTDGPASIRQAIFILLTTRPGERVMRPSYGCNLYRLAFSPNDNTTAGLVIHYVRRALERWEPRIEILRLDATPNPDVADQLDISLDYRIRAFRSTEQLTLAMNLAGAG
jgi:phage baseplate assembly protein W